MLEFYPHLQWFQAKRNCSHLLNLLCEARGVVWMALLCWAAVAFLCVAAEDVVSDITKCFRIES